MQYWELFAISSGTVLLYFLPQVLLFMMLKKNGPSSFRKLSFYESMIAGISIGILLILLPPSVTTMTGIMEIGQVFTFITIVNLMLPIIYAPFFIKRYKVRTVKKYTGPKIGVITLFIFITFSFYLYLTLIVPVDLSFDAANYFLPYAQGLLRVGQIPHDSLTLFTNFGGVPNQPPGLPIMYSYAMFVNDQGDSFKLLPLLFLFYLLLSTSLLAREIFSSIRMVMVAAVLLVFPPTFIYMVTTPYNSDLPFYSFFVASIFFLMKSKNDRNILWSILAGCNVSAMILTRDIGLVFFLPILAFLILGRKRSGKIWTLPLFVLIVIPFSFVLTPQLSEIYTEHSISLILLCTAILVVLWLLSKDLPIFKYNTSIWSFSMMLIPAGLFIFISVSVWGTPLMRTQIGFLTHQTTVDYSWAAEIATRELGISAFPIVPLSWQQMALNVVYLYASPAIGGLFFVPKIIGTFQGVIRGGTARLPLMLFLVFVLNWLVIFGGFSYGDYSAFRHLFDVVASLSILTVIGILALVFKQRGTREHSEILSLTTIVIVFTIQTVLYYEYSPALFSLDSRILIDEPFIQFILTSVAIFCSLYLLSDVLQSRLSIRIDSIIRNLCLAAAVLATIPFILSTFSVIIANEGSYERTSVHNLAHISYYRDVISVINYFNSKPVNGTILAYAIDSLDYRTDWQVLEMRTILDLAILKNILGGNATTTQTVDNLKELGVRYISLPLHGESARRMEALYGSTNFIKIFAEGHVDLVERFGNIGVFSLK